jgi:Protein of unknown function, DUF547
MNKIYLLLLVVVVSIKINAQTPELFFEQTNEFMKKNVSIDGKIDYASLKKSPGELLYILNNITKINAQFADKNKSKAFWINVYNLEVIRSVIDSYPIESVEKVKGFFKDNTFMVANQELTLDDIENTILREIFQDPCVHFVLSSAANGGATLLNEAYMPDRVNEQMKQQARKFVNNEKIIRIDKKSKAIQIPKIFEWYKDDFVTYYRNEIDFLNIFFDKKINNDLAIIIYDFDWSLNKK